MAVSGPSVQSAHFASASGTSLYDKLNSVWRERALQIFMAIVLAHWAEHLFQAYQIYVMGWLRPKLRLQSSFAHVLRWIDPLDLELSEKGLWQVAHPRFGILSQTAKRFWTRNRPGVAHADGSGYIVGRSGSQNGNSGLGCLPVSETAFGTVRQDYCTEFPLTENNYEDDAI